MSPKELYHLLEQRGNSVEDVAVLLIGLVRSAHRNNVDLLSLRIAFGFYSEIAALTGVLPEMRFSEDEKEQQRHNDVAKKLLEGMEWEL